MVRIIFIVAVIAAVFWLLRGGVGKNRMPVSEAAKILGISDQAGADEIIAAHKNLIAKVHPDAGGNVELAARVNQARDTMLARLSNKGP